MKRRGISLVEVVIVVGLIGVALSMAATLLAATMRMSRSVADDQLTQTQLARLAARIRSDAHGASGAELIAAVGADSDSAASGVRFLHEDGESILFQQSDDGLLREVRRGEKVAHRDRFILPAGTLAKFSLEELHGGQLARLTLQKTRSDKTHEMHGADTAVEAAVGIDRAPGSADVATEPSP